jgi:hypothetical protein
MRVFYIEMGQGIVVGGDCIVKTSPIYTCSFIAGDNEGSGMGGAYHYPASSIAKVRNDMDAWAAALRPTHVILIFADPFGGMGTTFDDKLALQTWVSQQCGNAVVETKVRLTAAMRLNPFIAGGVNEMNVDYIHHDLIKLDARPAGTYVDCDGFTLIGMNRQKVP